MYTQGVSGSIRFRARRRLSDDEADAKRARVKVAATIHATANVYPRASRIDVAPTSLFGILLAHPPTPFRCFCWWRPAHCVRVLLVALANHHQQKQRLFKDKRQKTKDKRQRDTAASSFPMLITPSSLELNPSNCHPFSSFTTLTANIKLVSPALRLG